MAMRMRLMWACCAWGCGLALAMPVVAAQAVDWRCEVVYQPARAVWSRQVHIGYDRHRVTDVRIDDVPVYAFMVDGNLVSTALDNERIQIDAARRTWRSDFRGQAQGEGRCEEGGAKGYDGGVPGGAASRVARQRP